MRTGRRIVLVVAAAAAAAALVWLLARKKGVSVRVERARVQDLSVPILCDATLEPGPSGEIRAPEAAAVAEIDVREGDRVEPGRVLVRLESPDLSQR
ncbi:MAG: hypothetical protein ACRD16_16715, partial [Thermoanaerobaculia bacterium]